MRNSPHFGFTSVQARHGNTEKGKNQKFVMLVSPATNRKNPRRLQGFVTGESDPKSLRYLRFLCDLCVLRFCSLSVVCLLLFATGCHRPPAGEALTPKTFGTQLVEVSGGKQAAGVGNDLSQPLVVQVNGADGNGVAGALVSFRGDGLTFTPAQALSDSSGQVSVTVRLGAEPRSYTVTAETAKPDHTAASLELREIALGYEQQVGKEINGQYCIRCHDSESTPERVSNFDNLSPSPHAFSDGTYLNNMKDIDLANITRHGGPALGKSASMPSFGNTLGDKQIKAVVAYIRAIADPPFQTSGVKYGK